MYTTFQCTYPSSKHHMMSLPALSRSHEFPNVPNTNPLIPPRTRGPSLRSKEAPVNSTDKLCMLSHPSQFPSHAFPISLHARRTRLQRLSFGAPIRPYTTRHVVTRTQQRVREVWTPCDAPHGIFVPLQDRGGPGVGGAGVEGADETVDACGCDYGGAIFVPVVG